MKFSRRRPEEPEINLIPFIDVLLVVLIFRQSVVLWEPQEEVSPPPQQV